MTRTRLSTVLLAASLLVAAGCANADETSKALDKTIESATENVKDAADDTANALGNAADDLGDLVQGAAEDVGKAIDNASRKESSAK
jgi:ABC-type glycerol-3-phosphate transport system substrate-binding protein